ncbi:hypothetical protein TNCV_1425231 [Trichonephila clavipes]|nr:hypothetical protein TNCV_1425231 [Trichonephila clavipes]
MAADWAGLVSSHAQPMEVYSMKSCPIVKRKRATASALYRGLGIGPTVARVSHGFPKLFVFWVMQYICQCMWRGKSRIGWLFVSYMGRGSLVVKWYRARTHDMPAMIRYLDHWATAALLNLSKFKHPPIGVVRKLGEGYHIRNDNICKPLSLCKMEQLFTLGVKLLLSATNFGENCDYPNIYRMHGLLAHLTYIPVISGREEFRILPDLKVSITRHVAEIPRELLHATIENAIMLFQHVIDVNEAHIEYIL